MAIHLDSRDVDVDFPLDAKDDRANVLTKLLINTMINSLLGVSVIQDAACA